MALKKPRTLEQKVKRFKALPPEVQAVMPNPEETYEKDLKAHGGMTVEERALTLQYFPELFLGLKVYPWQKRVLTALNLRESRVALRAANGSGKTKCIGAVAVIWHMMRFPGSLTVCTAGVYRQVVDALWPYLKAYSTGLGGEAGGWRVTESHVHHENGSRCVGFSATEGNKAEGWHRQGKDENLLYIVDEAKGVSDDVFQAVERCQPSRLLVMSSPGAPSGFFYNIFQRGGPEWDKFVATAFDCPHLTKDWISQQIAYWGGERSPIIQSMIFAEFVDDSGDALVLPQSVLQRAISEPAAKEPGIKFAGCDFAAGGDENVLCIRDGNEVKSIISWREKDTMAAVGRFIVEFKKADLSPENIYADGSGLGIPMCDALREAGWDVRRVNNGEAAFSSEKFANRGTEMWVQYARMIEQRKVRVFADDQLHRQLTTRRLEYNSKGKLILESKDKMRQRGLGSPDRADAVILAFAGAGAGLESHMLDPEYAPQSLWERMEEMQISSSYSLDGAEVAS